MGDSLLGLDDLAEELVDLANSLLDLRRLDSAERANKVVDLSDLLGHGLLQFSDVSLLISEHLLTNSRELHGNTLDRSNGLSDDSIDEGVVSGGLLEDVLNFADQVGDVLLDLSMWLTSYLRKSFIEDRNSTNHSLHTLGVALDLGGVPLDDLRHSLWHSLDSSEAVYNLLSLLDFVDHVSQLIVGGSDLLHDSGVLGSRSILKLSVETVHLLLDGGDFLFVLLDSLSHLAHKALFGFVESSSDNCRSWELSFFKLESSLEGLELLDVLELRGVGLQSSGVSADERNLREAR